MDLVNYQTMSYVFVGLFYVLCLGNAFKEQHIKGPPKKSRGVHICGPENACCPGWKKLGTSGKCLASVCKLSCGSGKCVHPDTCLCPNGKLSPFCEEGGTHSAVVMATADTRNCQTLGCSHGCKETGGNPHCLCPPGSVLQTDLVSCTDQRSCKEAGNCKSKDLHHSKSSVSSVLQIASKDLPKNLIQYSTYPPVHGGTKHYRPKFLKTEDSNAKEKGFHTMVPQMEKLNGEKVAKILQKNKKETFIKSDRLTKDFKDYQFLPIKKFKVLKKHKNIRNNFLPLQKETESKFIQEENENSRKAFLKKKNSELKYSKDLKDYKLLEDSGKELNILEKISLEYKDSGEAKLAKPSGNVLDVQKDGEWICRGDLCNQKLGQDSQTTPSSDNIDASKVKCPFGYQRGFIDGKVVCQQLRKSVLKKLLRKKKCPKGQKAALTFYGIDCVGPDGKKVCAEGQRLVERVEGQFCEEMTTVVPQCGEGYEQVKTSNGVQCKELHPTTPLMVTCPEGQIANERDDGPACVDVTTPTTLAPTSTTTASTTTTTTTTTDPATTTISTTAAPTTTTVTTTTEVICPDGLRRIRTSVGFVCHYVAPPSATTTALPTCPPGKTLRKTHNGHVCVSEPSTREPDTRCPSGQMLVKGSRGLRCKRMHGDIPEEYLCPPGLILVKTDSGTKCRRHKKTSVVKNVPDGGCAAGQVLTMSEEGFFCGEVVDDSRPHPVCPRGQVVVQVGGVQQCIRESQSKLQCGSGQVLTHTQNGFFCRHKKFDFRKHCEEGEVFIMENSSGICIQLSKGTNLCGPHYKAVMTKDGLVCRLFHLELGCPNGYYLIHTDDSPQCLPVNPSRENCDPDPNVPCSSSDPIVPCAEGYSLAVSGGSHVCELKEHVGVVCHDGAGTSAARCFIDSVRQCKSKAIQDGCHPQCANGGTCVDGVCVCPPGVTGKACQNDINECEWLPATFCEFDCRNTFGSFECTCPTGSTLNTDRRTCKVIQCVPACMNGGECQQGFCVCPSGFTGSVCQHDIDECSGRNPCEHYCRNTYGGFACLCPPGSRLAADQRSCQNTTCQPACRFGGRCVNGQCVCPKQFTGIICQLDVNECHQGTHGCSHACHNTFGSYRCSCPGRLTLAADRKTCRPFRKVHTHNKH